MVGSENPNGASPPPPQQSKKYGITKPISLAGPTEADFHRNKELEKFLVDSGLHESKEEAAKREEVLGRLEEIVKCWVKQLTRQRGYTDQMVEDANAVIFTFGSYRLGVHGPEADIDTLCVGPSYVNREEDFFIILHNILGEMEEVTELQPVTDAHVPVMKFKFQGISIDLLYASTSRLVVPQRLWKEKEGRSLKQFLQFMQSSGIFGWKGNALSFKDVSLDLEMLWTELFSCPLVGAQSRPL